jgi:hypothetical protein
MRIRHLVLAAVSFTGCAGATVRLPFQDLSSFAVHRFFPDLDRRENAVRYGRWRALDEAWKRGISVEVDAGISAGLKSSIRRLPDFPPDPKLCAPRFAREVPRAFEALVVADRFERRVMDALASSIATGAGDGDELARLLAGYERSASALSEPATPPAESPSEVSRFATSRLLFSGDWLFAVAAEDLSAADFREERWKVKASVEEYDRRLGEAVGDETTVWYRDFAPVFSGRNAAVSRVLDLTTRFRVELFRACASPNGGRRRAEVERVVRRYGLVR